MRILLAPDKFKRSLSALEACRAIERGLLSSWPDGAAPEIIHHPIADGGEGTCDAVVAALSGRWITADATDAHGRPLRARYGWIDQLPPHPSTSLSPTGFTIDLREPVAVIEMSAASGLAQVADLPADPWSCSSYGTGQLIRHAAENGAKSIFLGIGGSATNDGGCGMTAALGFQWVDGSGREIPFTELPTRLTDARRLDDTDAVPLPLLQVAVDVTNPLLGENGATRIYGPQKGIAEADFERHEARLAHLANLVRDARPALSADCIDDPGRGAAGGLGFSLRHQLGASLLPGFELIATLTALEQSIRDADLVITGEGRFDRQSLNGKGPTGVAHLARRNHRPVAAVCGLLDPDAAAEAGFDASYQAKPDGMSIDEAIARATELLTDCVRQNTALLRAMVGAR